MSDALWKKINFYIGFLVIGVLFGLTVFLANVEVKDLDLWLHLKVGEFIIQNGFVPSVDVLSCSIQGSHWVNHEWLFQVITYLIYKTGGADGLISMQAFVVVATFILLLFLGYNKDRQLGTVFGLLLVLLVYQGRFTIRPDIFSLLFFAVYIYVLSLHIDKRWSIYALLFVQIVWTNMHGFFFFGPLIVLVGIIGETIKRTVPLPYEWNKSGRLTNNEFGRLRWLFLIVALGCLMNPLTVHGALYPLKVLFQISGSSKIFFSHIQELQKPIEWGSIFSNQYMFYKLLILLSGLSFVFNRRKLDIGVLMFWMIFLFFSLTALRNMIFFAFAAYLVFIVNTINISLFDLLPVKFSDKKFQHLTSAILKIILILWMVQFGDDISFNSYFDFDTYERKSEFGGISKRNYAYKAVDFLVENNVKGNFFNDFNSGAYLIGRAYPNIKVFIDGRTEVYGPEFFNKYRKIWDEGDVPLFEELESEYDFTGVFLNSVYRFVPDKLCKYLYGREDWKIVYFGFDAVVFLKDVPLNQEIINKYAIDLSTWQADSMDLHRLGAMRVTPYQHVHRAHVLQALDFHDAALTEIDDALKVNPSYAIAHRMKGEIYSHREDYVKAFEHFRIAAMFEPQSLKNRTLFAKAYEHLEDYDNAIEQYKKILKYAPRNVKGHFALAKAYAKNKQYNEMFDLLEKGSKLGKDNAKGLLEAGDVAVENESYDEALKVYRMALELNHKSFKAHHKLGMAFKAMNNNESARESLEKALELAPDNEELKKAIKDLGRNNK